MEGVTRQVLLDSVRAAPPDPTGVVVFVWGDNVHGIVVNILVWVEVTIRLVIICVRHTPCEVSPIPSPPPVEYPMPESVSKQRDKS